MTNQMIIFTASVQLMEQGILQGSGHKVTVQGTDGEIELEAPEAIHTYQRWKELGY